MHSFWSVAFAAAGIAMTGFVIRDIHRQEWHTLTIDLLIIAILTVGVLVAG